jgi:hypothetical protein
MFLRMLRLRPESLIDRSCRTYESEKEGSRVKTSRGEVSNAPSESTADRVIIRV